MYFWNNSWLSSEFGITLKGILDGVSGLLYVGTCDVVPKLGEPLCLVRMQANLDVRQMARNAKTVLKQGQR